MLRVLQKILILSFLSVQFANLTNTERIRYSINRKSLGIGRGQDATCELPNFKNGIAKLKQRRKLLKFDCDKGFRLRGSRYTGCVEGKWDMPIPVCAKKGCPKIDPPNNGFVEDEHQGLEASLRCKESYQVAGSRIAYCDGVNWDRELGSCRESGQSAQLRCDFETEDLCGWTHDDSNDLEWRRELGSDSQHLRTGPIHDHTSQIEFQGHYMLVESTSSSLDDRARLISPLYAANQSRNACFRLFYHMYGATVGSLRIYVKPLSVDLDTMLQDARYRFFNVSGNQRNVWRETIFELDSYSESFQVIIEGTAGTGHLSDIAIDDVALMHDNECTNERLITRSPEVEERGGIFDYRSCLDRCNETEQSRFSDTVAADGGVIKQCDCDESCVTRQSCCPDYVSLCAFGDTETSTQQLSTTDDVDDDTSTVVEQSTGTSTSSTSKLLNIPSITTRRTTVSASTSTIASTSAAVTRTTATRSTKNPRTTPSSDLSPTVMQQDEPAAPWHTPSGHTIQPEGLDPAPGPITIVLVSLIAVIVLIVGATVSMRIYRKKYDPQNYKKNAENTNRRRKPNSNNEEFSDVRYLTSDEQIDFTVQTPKT